MSKILIIAVIAVIAGLAFTGCGRNEPVQQDDPVTPADDPVQPADSAGCDLNQFRYTETTADGTLSFFLDKTYEKVRFVLHEKNGESRQYYVPLSLLSDIYSHMQAEDMLSWKYLDSKDVEAESDTKIEIEYRIKGMSGKFGSVRMPAGGIEKLRKFREIAARYEADNAETKPFTVTINGKEYNTVRGTGNSVGTGAEIDFGEDRWWLVEGFAGHYELTAKAKEEMNGRNSGSGNWYKAASLDISEDGSLVLKVDDDVRKTTVDSKRLYGCYATAMQGEIEFVFEPAGSNDSMLRLMMRGLPYPEKFAGYDLYLERTK